MTESDYEDLEEVAYFKMLYPKLSEQDKIHVLLLLENKSGLQGWQLSIVSDYCKVERDIHIDDMWFIGHGLPVPKEKVE